MTALERDDSNVTVVNDSPRSSLYSANETWDVADKESIERHINMFPMSEPPPAMPRATIPQLTELRRETSANGYHHGFGETQQKKKRLVRLK